MNGSFDDYMDEEDDYSDEHQDDWDDDDLEDDLEDDDDDYSDEEDDCSDDDDDYSDEEDDDSDEDQDDWDDDDPEDDGSDNQDDDSDEDGDRLHQDLERLSYLFPLCIDDDYRFVIVRAVRLPPGYNCNETSLLIELPPDYPCSPPGIAGYRVFASPNLRFRGRPLADLHPHNYPGYATPGFGPWAWLCYQAIAWDLFTDNLVKFVEMVRADLTDPPTA